MTTKKHSKWQARWAKFLSRFNFVISYIQNRKNRKADSITCQLNNCPANDHKDR